MLQPTPPYDDPLSDSRTVAHRCTATSTTQPISLSRSALLSSPPAVPISHNPLQREAVRTNPRSPRYSRKSFALCDFHRAYFHSAISPIEPTEQHHNSSTRVFNELHLHHRSHRKNFLSKIPQQHPSRSAMLHRHQHSVISERRTTRITRFLLMQIM